MVLKTYFFDNDEKQVEDMRNNIENCEAIHVDDKNPNPLGTRFSYSKNKVFENNKYVAYLKTGGRPAVEPYPPGNGLTDVHINELVKDINKKEVNTSNIAVVFDWDRTLSVVEGVVYAEGI